MSRRAKLFPALVAGVVHEVRRGAGDPRPVSVAGARALVPILAAALREGGDPSAVVEGQVADASVLVWIGQADEAQLRAASRAGVPIVAVTEAETLPYVKATDLVRVPPGESFPVEEIAAVLAHRLGENATALAARLPVLRPAVCHELISSFSRRNSLISAAVFLPGADLPVLTVNQLRLVVRLGLAHGLELDSSRAPELLAVVGSAFGFRAAVRRLDERVPVPRWAVRATVAYFATTAVGEAALRSFEARGLPA